MKGKKVLDFLILKPAFTSRNISSLGLVAIFFLVYWLAGGKVAVPPIKQGSNFGSVNNERLNQTATSGQSPTSAILQHKSNLSPSNVMAPKEETTDSSAEKSKQLDEKLQKLNELEERLKSLKRAKSGGD